MEDILTANSLLDELGLRNHYQIVAEKNGRLVYAHTVYYELTDEDYESFITEDDEPVDNILSEIEQRNLTEILQSSAADWTDRDFMACANVGVYYAKGQFVVPDMFLSMDVKYPTFTQDKKTKTYFAWHMGKLPDLVLEIVSNKIGQEDTEKMALYARLGIRYYIIHDPYFYLSKTELRVYELKANERYELITDPHHYMPEVNLGIQLWRGVFEQSQGFWVRWCSKNGELLKTGKRARRRRKNSAPTKKNN
ncbi:MAG: Uma2 family endonuclease, partial [Microscillaceae bacterium]|nr:Uma2 family endonuclease [Microscillaceae bacterium]